MKLSSTLAVVPLTARLAQAALDVDAVTEKYFGNDAPWYHDRIPLFESSDSEITEVYYYRWNVFRTHQRDVGTKYGYITTEFIDNVGWQTQPWASNNCAAIFHLSEGRWCRDPRFKQDHATFMYSADSNPRQYSESLADGVWRNYLVDGNPELAISLLDDMQRVYNEWVGDHYDETKGLFWIEPLADATEYTIASIDASGGYDGFGGGQAFRPTINTYQYANARAIAKIAALKGGLDDVVAEYNNRADAIKETLQRDLWNSTFEHFIDRFFVNNENVTYWDFIRGRELAGIVPWAHDLPDDDAKFGEAWKHVLSSDQLGGPFGLRTVEPSYEYYMRVWRYEGTQTECHWNGPSWPYQTTQVLTSLANVLDHYPNSSSLVNVGDYTRLLKQYANQHYNKHFDNILDIEENYDPDTGEPIVGLGRSHHYFHSGYVDLILSGFVGIRPRADDVLEVNPLADPSSISYFRAERILYHGQEIAVQWDATGDRYGEAGLRVEVGGQVVASSDKLERLTVDIARSTVSVSRPFDQAIQLQADITPPIVNTSVANYDINRLHDVFDGRIWFWTQDTIANGLDTPEGSTTEEWVSTEFGAAVTISRAEIAFFANEEKGLDVPASYKLQVLSGEWTDVADATYDEPLANGITNVKWTGVSTESVRILVTPKEGKKVRLVELKVFTE
ncbi:Beta-L-arabinobiosidase [Colletotrichum siamense]|uniref:Beta-L-arabinobiosidase n=1 Tax=Colletotrichum siamense TaxID=690259 RepID=A0A9P5EUY3_COLSI|nr:Beta-L-arabinobiosidase [Colletotrichum siamense]KAF4859990.1 Beta-L-arabinobiosidase [Colletotrichum siamense]KAI8212565.1 Beta-L-arabinobiosidase [Colletotrichum sp. SAR 10_76]